MLDDRRQTSPIAADDWARGRVGAPVTILEYGDFECPHCGAAFPELEAVLEARPDVVRLLYRHFPIASTHPHATSAAEAAEAAGAQGRFWEMHDQLFTHQAELENERLVAYARVLGLDLLRFTSELTTHVHLPKVRRHFQLGVTDGVNGTPTLFLDGVRYDGPRERGAILQAVEAELGTQRGRGAA